MRISLTIESAGTATDVVLDVDDATPVSDVEQVLAAEVGATAGPLATAEDHVVVVDPEAVPHPAGPDGAATVSGLGLVDGSRVGVDGHRPSSMRPGSEGLQLHVLSGPAAGAIFGLPSGVHEIGRSGSLSWDDHSLSRRHARLTVSQSGVTVADLGSSNGTFMDGARLDHAPIDLPLGDVVALGDSLIAVRAARDVGAKIEVGDPGWLNFLRPPRIAPWYAAPTVEVPRPPTAPSKRKFPLVMLLAPLAFGVVMSGMMYLVFHSNYAFMFLMMAFMSPVMMLANYISDKRGGAKDHREAVEEYTANLAKAQQKLTDSIRSEQVRLRETQPDAADTYLTAVLPGRRLWERRRHDPDFLNLRVAATDLPSTVKITGAKEVEEHRLADVPVGFELEEHHVVGIAGPDDIADGILRWQIGQMCTYHSPRDLTLSFLSLRAGTEWNWLRWLPHARPDDPDGALALIGNDEETITVQVAFLLATIRARKEATKDQHRVEASSFPAHVVVLHGYRSLRGTMGLGQVLEEGPEVGVYAICTDDAENSLPERCQATAVVDASNPSLVSLNRRGAVPVLRALGEQVTPAWCMNVARQISPLRDVSAQADGASLPDSARFLDVVKMEPPTSDTVRTRWMVEPRSTAMTLGIGMEGPFTLDLAGDGPHGLIAGMTGSGKTELLQTIIASLAVANRPEWLNFVLIDYKGDSAFKDCVNLPHTVGKVNDLDPYLVERALASLEAELDVRKNILAEAGVKDIEDYQDLQAKETWRDPLPRLVLVIDEFAELANELPDFMDGLVSIAQLGRSLGVHLLLATQRPSGVVSPKIRANTNMRIALRVAESSDSTDVLQSPEAAKIPKSAPGRAYARLGAGALLPFQSGRVGGRRPGAVVVDLPKPFVARAGWKSLGYMAPRSLNEKSKDEVSDTDLKALVAAISDAAEAEAIPAQRQPWLDPLPERVLWTDWMDGKPQRGAVPPLPWGRSDIPSQQRQVVAVFDLDRDGHMFFVGSTKSGRSQVLRTLAGSIAHLADPSDIHLYGIDCGSGALNPMTALPHCGAVVGRSEPERAARLLSRLAQEVDERQQTFAASGYADIGEQRRRDPQPLPHLVVMLDRWEGFATSLGDQDDLNDLVLKILREGASAGLHMVITGDRTLAINSRLASTTENKWAFKLADKGDYPLVGLLSKQVPDRMAPGRCFGPGAVETQVMLLSSDESGQGQASALQSLAAAADALVGPDTVRPFRVDVLPSRITLEEALGHRPSGAQDPFVLVGVGGDDLSAFGADLGRGAFIVAGPARSGRSTVLMGAAQATLATGGNVIVVAPRPSPIRDLAGRPGVLAVHTDMAATAEELRIAALARTGPVVVVIDDAEGMRDVPANEFYLEVIRGQVPNTLLMVGGHLEGLGMGLMGWQVEAKKARQGLLLSPQGLGDGDLVGVRVPRNVIGRPVQPGRGWLHLGGGELVQVATAAG